MLIKPSSLNTPKTLMLTALLVIIVSRLVWVQSRPTKIRHIPSTHSAQSCTADTRLSLAGSEAIKKLMVYSCGPESATDRKSLVLVAFLLCGLIARLSTFSWFNCCLVIAVLISGSRPLFLSEVPGLYNYFMLLSTLMFLVILLFFRNPHIIYLVGLALLFEQSLMSGYLSFYALMVSLLLLFVFLYQRSLISKNNAPGDKPSPSFFQYSNKNSIFARLEEPYLRWASQKKRARDQLTLVFSVLIIGFIILYKFDSVSYAHLFPSKARSSWTHPIDFYAIFHLKYLLCLASIALGVWLKPLRAHSNMRLISSLFLVSIVILFALLWTVDTESNTYRSRIIESIYMLEPIAYTLGICNLRSFLNDCYNFLNNQGKKAKTKRTLMLSKKT